MRLRLAGEKPPLVVATAQFFANEPVFPKERLRGRTLPQGNSYVAPEHDHGRKCVQSGAQAPKSAVIQGELRYRERYRPGAVGGVGGVAVRFKGRCNGALRGGCPESYHKREEAMQDKHVGQRFRSQLRRGRGCG